MDEALTAKSRTKIAGTAVIETPLCHRLTMMAD
jgi:hypothetical protein